MATTDFPLNHPLAVKRWSSELFKEALKATHAMQFIGKTANSIVQIKTEVNKQAGDRITFGIRQQLKGGGVQGDNILEGHEENLETFHQNVIIDQLRHAVRTNGRMSDQRVPFEVRDEARDGLVDWWADRIDAWFFNQLCGNTTASDVRFTGMQSTTAPDTDHVVFPASATAESSLSNSTVHRFSLDLIDRAVERAKVAVNALRPITVGSKQYLVAFLHPFQVTDLRTNTNTGQWLDIQKAALSGNGDKDNPIFSGALGVYNGVILHESVRIPETLPNVRRAVLLGAQAGVMAFGRGHGKGVYDWVEKRFDYNNQLGVAAGCIGGMVKTRFNGSDFAAIAMPTWAQAK